MAREVTEFVTPADLDAIPDGTTYKRMSTTEQTKLGGIEEGADVNPTDLADLDSTAATKLGNIEDNATADQTAAEMQASILGQSDADIGLMAVSASSGEKKVYSVHINASGNLEADNEDTAES